MALEMRFRSWLEEFIVWQGQEEVPRWKAIRVFVEEGLVPFVYECGYKFAMSDKNLANIIATGLFGSRGKSSMESIWPTGGPHPDGAAEEDEAHFHHVIGPERWSEFLSRWGLWEDVCPDISSRGEDRRLDIQAATWSCLDLSISPQSQVLYEIIMGGEEEDAPHYRPGQQGVDSYLQDAEHNGWGGYRR